MFGNKYAGEDIAREMLSILNKSDSHTKTASEEEASEASDSNSEAALRPEDFLVPPEMEEKDVGSAIDNSIKDVSSYAEDENHANCPTHNMAYDKCGCKADDKTTDDESHAYMVDDESHAYMADDESHAYMAEDMSYLMDSRANHILEGLGKVAGSLRAKNENFAADLVEATAMGIRNDFVKEAQKKAKVINALTKMASDFYKQDKELAGDLVTVTINKIKNN